MNENPKRSVQPTSKLDSETKHNRCRRMRRRTRLVNLHIYRKLQMRSEREKTKKPEFIIPISHWQLCYRKQAFEYKWQPTLYDSDICFRNNFVLIASLFFPKNACFVLPSFLGWSVGGVHYEIAHIPHNFPWPFQQNT